MSTQPLALRRKRIGTPSTRSETPAWACPTLECHTPRVGAPSQHRGSETYPETREGSPLVLRTEIINFVDNDKWIGGIRSVTVRYSDRVDG